MKIVNKTINYTKTCRDALKIMLSIKDGAHNAEHIVRVYDWSRQLARKYTDVDLNVLKVAAYWHDVGRKYESKHADDHNIISGQMVEKYLKKNKASKQFVEKVKEAVINHSFSNKPQSIEGKIIHDADKLAFLPAHTILDSYNSMKEGYETRSFNKENLTYALKVFLKEKQLLYTGLILKESKEIYKKFEKEFQTSASTVVTEETK